MPFDEQRMLVDNVDYLMRSLKLGSIAVHTVADADAVAAAPQQVDVLAAYPGNPLTVFHTTKTPQQQ